MTDQTPTRAPAGLEKRGRRLWREVLSTYSLRSDELATLEELARGLDLLERLENELRGQPLVLSGSKGQPRAHPLLAELRSHRQVVASLCRLLGLGDVTDTASDDEAPPTPRQARAKRAAEIRWSRRGTP